MVVPKASKGTATIKMVHLELVTPPSTHSHPFSKGRRTTFTSELSSLPHKYTNTQGHICRYRGPTAFFVFEFNSIELIWKQLNSRFFSRFGWTFWVGGCSFSCRVEIHPLLWALVVACVVSTYFTTFSLVRLRSRGGFFFFLHDSFLMEFRADGLPVQLVVGGAVQRGEGERGTIYVVFGQSRIDSIWDKICKNSFTQAPKKIETVTSTRWISAIA